MRSRIVWKGGIKLEIDVGFKERKLDGGVGEDDDEVVSNWLEYWRLVFNQFEVLIDGISKSVKYKSLSK